MRNLARTATAGVAPAPPGGTARPPTTLSSYSRLRQVRPAEMHVAHRVDEVAELFARASAQRRRVTVRAGGRSFDDQALNDDIVVDVGALHGIAPIDVGRREVTVEGSARWGAIVEATLPRGLVPHIVVTTPGATAGGTLSANCLSRCSPRYGHTGDHVRSLELLTTGGAMLTCSRETNADLFRAAIGGFGYFGFVAKATFDLLEIGPRRNVRTVIDRCEGLRPFVERLVEASLRPEPYDAVYSVYSLAQPQRGAVFKSHYTDEPVGNTLRIYRSDSWSRTLGELLFVSSRLANALCHASYVHEFPRGPFVDDLRGYTFCMKGNERAKALADAIGVRFASFQHSYVVPTESLAAFLEDSAHLFCAHDVYPSLLDALYRPSDDYLLSSANALPGFCVSYVFEGVGSAKLRRVQACLLEITEAAMASGGRLHLGKNVHATPRQTRAMYGHALGELGRLKAKHDPHGVLVNDFFRSAFG